ncbi:MAG: 1-phosphofructokinase family hexose kinase [Anaerolineae bacterium]
MKKIVTLTLNPSLDKSTAVDTVASEIKLRCDTLKVDPGGGGVNVSRAIHKLGGESVAVLSLGGCTGETLARLLAAEGLTVRGVPVERDTRESFVVFERSTTLQFRFGLPGEPLKPAEWAALMDAAFAEQPDYLVASGSVPPSVPDDIYVQIARRAQAAGVRLIVDTSGAALAAMSGAQAYLLKPNLHELEILSGEKFTGEEQMLAAARHMISKRMAEVLVISLGAAGAALVTAEEFVEMKPPVVPIQSKVGAGDSMVGGMTLALARGWSLRDAVRYGIAAGSAAVMTPGTELCRREDVESIYPRVKTLQPA